MALDVINGVGLGLEADAANRLRFQDLRSDLLPLLGLVEGAPWLRRLALLIVSLPPVRM